MFDISCIFPISLFRKLLRDGIKIANAQDLNGITAITLLMLGTTFHCEGSDGAIKVSTPVCPLKDVHIFKKSCPSVDVE